MILISDIMIRLYCLTKIAISNEDNQHGSQWTSRLRSRKSPKKRMKGLADDEPRRRCPRLPSEAHLELTIGGVYGRGGARGSHWLCAVPVTDRSSCDLLWWLLIVRCNEHLKRLFSVCFANNSSHMFSWKRVGGRNAISDSDGPDVNNKAVTDPPAVTTKPLQL
ncbi:hypothetical protein T10_454 [Trichinella papuae]|uniref:Uncharacterized protein n=1 Tax=Trichinella papuae TaxID=268474 RepID=A0A0V1MXA0_9BILA|nr:hypothetical protein T10_454 [Trichinella papuae]